MSNSNYGIGLQCLKPVHTAYGAICMPICTGTIALQFSSVSMVMVLSWSSARDVNGRDRDVDNFAWDETESKTTTLPMRCMIALYWLHYITLITKRVLCLCWWLAAEGTVFGRPCKRENERQTDRQWESTESVLAIISVILLVETSPNLQISWIGGHNNEPISSKVQRSGDDETKYGQKSLMNTVSYKLNWILHLVQVGRKIKCLHFEV